MDNGIVKLFYVKYVINILILCDMLFLLRVWKCIDFIKKVIIVYNFWKIIIVDKIVIIGVWFKEGYLK